MEGNVNWIPLGILGLIVVIWATKFLTAIRLKQKLKKAWDGAPFFRKKDTEESLIDSLAYPAKGQTIDSQVDDQTWHVFSFEYLARIRTSTIGTCMTVIFGTVSHRSS